MQFEKDSYKRFEMLLKKTENFSHCLSAGDIEAITRKLIIAFFFFCHRIFIWIFRTVKYDGAIYVLLSFAIYMNSQK